MRLGNALVAGLAEPEGGLEVVLLHPDAAGIHVADIELRLRKALLRGFQVKPEGDRQVRRHPETKLMHHAKIELGGRVAAVGRLLVEADRLGDILRGALAIGVNIAERVKRLGVALLGTRPQRGEVDLGPRGEDRRAKREQRRRKEGAVFLREGETRGRRDGITHELRLRTKPYSGARRHLASHG